MQVFIGIKSKIKPQPQPQPQEGLTFAGRTCTNTHLDSERIFPSSDQSRHVSFA
jgi:hypothetical protein